MEERLKAVDFHDLGSHCAFIVVHESRILKRLYIHIKKSDIYNSFLRLLLKINKIWTFISLCVDLSADIP